MVSVPQMRASTKSLLPAYVVFRLQLTGLQLLPRHHFAGSVLMPHESNMSQLQFLPMQKAAKQLPDSSSQDSPCSDFRSANEARYSVEGWLRGCSCVILQYCVSSPSLINSSYNGFLLPAGVQAPKVWSISKFNLNFRFVAVKPCDCLEILP